MAEVARLRSIGLLHLIEQELPCFVVGLDLLFVPLRQLEGLHGVPEPLARDSAIDLLQSAMCPLNLGRANHRF